VEVHSSWFPLIDRNPQKFCDMFYANESDFQRATHRLYVGGANASSLTVSLIEGDR
jgi:uncharacterized protein